MPTHTRKACRNRRRIGATGVIVYDFACDDSALPPGDTCACKSDTGEMNRVTARSFRTGGGVLLTLLMNACGPASAPEPDAVAAAAHYVGRETCAACHADEHRRWQGSHHDLAMQVAGPGTVLGDFDNAAFEYFGTVSRFYREGYEYRVETDNAQGELESFRVACTFGVDPLQQYLVEFPGGRLQALGIAWDSRPAGEGGQRWFHLYPGEEVSHGDPLHWTARAHNWNSMCAECHVTGLQKNYEPASDRYATTWSEIDVSCEACHGPGSTHADWARQGGRGEDPRLTVDLDERGNGAWVMNHETGIAELLKEASGTRHQPEACGRCHSRRMPIVEQYEHGRPLLESYVPSLLEAGLYYPDGQIHDEVFVYGSFLQSRMYAAGVTCTDCHDAHSLQLKTSGTPSDVCSQCHLPDKFAQPGHHFHENGEVQCVDCHMAARNFMVVDPRRDHSFRVPRPDLSLTTGAPNACMNCHDDRTAGWAAAAVADRYGADPEAALHYGAAIHAARRSAGGGRRAIQAVIDNDDAPAIARATALTLLPPPRSNADIERLQRGLVDDDPIVRLGAVRALNSVPADLAAQLATSPLADPLRGVRVSAVEALARARPYLTQAGREIFDDAAQEFIDAQKVSADFPSALTNLGNFHRDLGQADAAVSSYEHALRLQADWTAARINLADLYRQQGDNGKAIAELAKGLALRPHDAALNHAMGLAVAREGRHDQALDYLANAVEQAPDSVRYRYVLAIALHSTGDTAQSLALLLSLNESAPGDFDVLWALATVNRDAGDAHAARKYARSLAAEYPEAPEAQRLLQQLRAER